MTLTASSWPAADSAAGHGSPPERKRNREPRTHPGAFRTLAS
ncbi:hypothetical protein SFR_5333 [Streptomyces sp. FR-008]|nr:hypothetical protein SFR_5333 [Streptomyces sp. FR-008]